jgi:hypothetical protein
MRMRRRRRRRRRSFIMIGVAEFARHVVGVGVVKLDRRWGVGWWRGQWQIIGGLEVGVSWLWHDEAGRGHAVVVLLSYSGQ